MNEEKTINNAAYYWEVCVLHHMLKIGLINHTEYDGICQIAAQDYEATLTLEASCV